MNGQKSFDIENRSESLKQVHNEIGNTLLLFGTIFGNLGALAAFLRSFHTGLTAANIIHICLALTAVVIYFTRNRFTGKTKVAIVIAILFIASLAGFYNYGIVAAAPLMMIALIVVTTIIFPLRYSFGFFFITILLIAASGALHFAGTSFYSINVNEYFNHVTSWLATFATAVMVSAIIIASLTKLYNYLFRLTDALDGNRLELRASVEELQAMNEEFESQNNELLEAHANLTEHEELFRAVFESANDCMLLVDTKGIVFQCNQKCEDLLGGSIKGKPPWSFSPEYQPDGTKSTDLAPKIFKEIINGSPQWFTWRRQHVNGRFIETETSGRLIKTGDRNFVLVIIRDLTEQKKLEAQLLQSQKMEAMGTLTSGLSHDFNNMLGGIMGGASLIKTFIQKSEFEKKEKIETYTDAIINSSHRASDMIGQLMNLSRNQETSFEPVDLNQSVSNVLQIMHNSFPKSIAIELQKYEGKALVNAEQTQIEQVLLNICINASHAMTIMRPREAREGGILNITIDYTPSGNMLSSISHDADKNMSYFIIKITDTGIGMDETIRPQLFDPFFTTKGKGTGTGLGLSMAYNIIKNHKGFITVYSEPGAGSSFSLYLPEALETDRGERETGEKEKIYSGQGSILVIDDEIIQRTITAGMLQECGYQVLSAAGGQEAIDVFQKGPDTFDLVLTDLSMPDMDGIEVYQNLKKINPRIKAVITSGFRYDKRIERGLEMGIISFIEKPFSIIKLSKVVAEAVNQ